MPNVKKQTAEDLLCLVAAERESHAPDEVAAAERELIRRLGGTREDRARRTRAAGSGLVTMGLVTVLFGIVVSGTLVLHPGLKDVTRGVGIAGVIAFFILTVLLGLIEVFKGLALRRCVQPAKRDTLSRLIAGDVYDALPRPEDPCVSELMRIVGTEKASHTPEEVDRTLRQLRHSYQKAVERTFRAVRPWLFFLAVYAFLVGLMLSMEVLTSWADYWGAAGNGDPPQGAAPWRLIGFVAMLLAVPLSFGVGIGAVGFLRRKEWGRRLLIVAARVLVYVVVLVGLPIAVLHQLATGAAALEAAAFGLSGLVFAVCVLWVCVYPACNPLARDACTGAGGGQA